MPRHPALQRYVLIQTCPAIGQVFLEGAVERHRLDGIAFDAGQVVDIGDEFPDRLTIGVGNDRVFQFPRHGHAFLFLMAFAPA